MTIDSTPKADPAPTADAWLYEGEVMVYKKDHRCPDLVQHGFTETPLFYNRGTPVGGSS